MSRTRRALPGWAFKKEPTSPGWNRDSWYVWSIAQCVRGHVGRSYAHQPRRGGGWGYDSACMGDTKRDYKKRAARMRRREAKAELRRW